MHTDMPHMLKQVSGNFCNMQSCTTVRPSRFTIDKETPQSAHVARHEMTEQLHVSSQRSNRPLA